MEGIVYDSRRVQKNGLFVAVRGEKSDGHQFIEQAIEKGASVIVAEQRGVSMPAPPASWSRTAASRSPISALPFIERPALRLKMAAVTGTNGKTTTTFLHQTHLRKCRAALWVDRHRPL